MKRYGAILADPPWQFQTWSDKGRDRSPDKHYATLSSIEIMRLPVAQLAAADCVLFLWATWPLIETAFATIRQWGFQYKTCGFVWVKINSNGEPFIGNGYWTRSNSEFCLLATRGSPKRLHADVPQAIIEPRREHSRKPDCVHKRIERLIKGPYIELFARQRRRGWAAWGNEIDKFQTGRGSA